MLSSSTPARAARFIKDHCSQNFISCIIAYCNDMRHNTFQIRFNARDTESI